MKVESLSNKKLKETLEGAQEDLIFHRDAIKFYPDPYRYRTYLKQKIKIDESVIKMCKDEIADRKEKKTQNVSGEN